ncbi:GatB/GatE catalytic domain-domain-containing protein [Phakopsora pachyrhizi]|uniref:GatB/GatE catalytic domain-domain-containing protein n=1 Tax=Phakopsora pachyrhizi TaxID=170000 RepID=A0AAV0BB09_PHAPC|nr:GatB/GatE catalytic domain-domain-containing protein [Phakopsora pachyrhizi]
MYWLDEWSRFQQGFIAESSTGTASVGPNQKSSQQLRGEPSAVESEVWKLQPDQQYHQNLSSIYAILTCFSIPPLARTPLVNQHFNTSVSKFYASIPESQPILLLDCLRNGRILIGKDDGVDREFEDTAKSYKERDLDKVTLIDLNRFGVGLIEIVAEPDLKMAKEASSFVRKLQTLLRFLSISKVNIEQGEIYIPERPDSMIKRIWKDKGLRLVVVLLRMYEYSESEEPKEPEDMDKGDFNISNDSLPRGLGRWRDRSMSRWRCV